MSVWPAILVIFAFAVFAVLGVVLAVIDIRTHRLPNRLVLPGYPVAIALFTTACVAGAPWLSLLRAVIAMGALFGFYLGLRLLSRSGLGGGDVKLAGLIGLHLGWLGWAELAIGAVAAFVLGGLYAVSLLTVGRADRRTRVAFGPWMLVGAWIGILLSVSLASVHPPPPIA
ncbi:prepilin peptidase [Microbacterium rhizomatis]|uniref:Prepilin peptidase n=1 Tax=Microbacterium rhizomatis TaxID=1631477 RepID=A0A5J5J745_9MICO|nr:A24 family peptidase [Microbacterium rhizomatis]KAA9110954.1 prepilin peptidase [Microbacterium rhizomatis]